MWMRIAGAHQRAAIFKWQNVIDPRKRAELRVLFGESVDYGAKSLYVHTRHTQIMLRRKTDDAADAGFAASDEQFLYFDHAFGCVGSHGWKIVIENKCTGILRILCAVDANISGAHVTFGIVGERFDGCGRFDAALPGASGASGRDENPFAGERVVAAVRILGEIDHVMHLVSERAHGGFSISSIVEHVRIGTLEMEAREFRLKWW